MKSERKRATYSYEEVMQNVRTYITKPEDIDLIERAYQWAKKAHENQYRKSGEPYIIHPISVAYILTTLTVGPATIAAGFLHDVVEDTPITLEEIAKEFGPQVAKLVSGVTKLDKLQYRASDATSANYQKLIISMVEDVRVIIIKLADRLHNMRTIGNLREEKQKRIAQETMDILVPIAHRLGIYKIKSELEDISFKILHRDHYYEMAALVNKRQEERLHALDAMMKRISTILDEQEIEFEIQGRIKNMYSIYKKVVEKGKDFNEIFDLLAIRILTDTVRDCYAILGFIHNEYRPIPNRIKDYIAMPKPNMYQSLHTTVLGDQGTIFEVQIRTHEMDRIAEYGIAAHWAYKENNVMTSEQEQRQMEQEVKIFKEIKAIIEDADDTTNETEFIEAVKADVLSANVYVFTPRGDVYSLTSSATPLDFAYRIHSEVGNKATGFKVNNRIVPISYELKTGDVVEVLTSSSAKPSESWLRIVKTGHAKSKIRQYFKHIRRDENIMHGKDFIERELEIRGLEWQDFINSSDLNATLERYGQKSLEEAYIAIGSGSLSVRVFINKLLGQPKDTRDLHSDDNNTIIKNEPQAPVKTPKNVITIGNDVDNVLINLANCCAPIPNDPIVGYISKGKGIIVHRTDCPSVKQMGERFINVGWAENIEKTKHKVYLRVISFDRPGLLSEIINSLYAVKTDIIDITSTVNHDSTVTTRLTVTAVDTMQLDKIKLSIQKISGVYTIERTTK
ncbi:MAG: RelA/SpoT family protein [Culicoidibacterales bacterium]